ncbi:hypothetical protein D3C87_2048180 [compost metagenome]
MSPAGFIRCGIMVSCCFGSIIITDLTGSYCWRSTGAGAVAVLETVVGADALLLTDDVGVLAARLDADGETSVSL